MGQNVQAKWRCSSYQLHCTIILYPTFPVTLRARGVRKMLLPYFGTGQPFQNTGAVAPIRSTDFTKTFISPPPLPPQHSNRVYDKVINQKALDNDSFGEYFNDIPPRRIGIKFCLSMPRPDAVVDLDVGFTTYLQRTDWMSSQTVTSKIYQSATPSTLSKQQRDYSRRSYRTCNTELDATFTYPWRGFTRRM